MTLGKEALEKVLIKRCGPKMIAASMDGLTIDGTNADLADPIGYAIRRLGLSVARIDAVTDAEVAAVPVEQYDKLLDWAELRTLENIAGNLDVVNLTVGPRSESLSQLYEQVIDAIERKQKSISTRYGGFGSFETGVIGLGFQERGLE